MFIVLSYAFCLFLSIVLIELYIMRYAKFFTCIICKAYHTYNFLCYTNVNYEPNQISIRTML